MSNKCRYELFETKINCTLTDEFRKRYGSPEHLVLKLQIYGTQQLLIDTTSILKYLSHLTFIPTLIIHLIKKINV
jgi:hypothetical protein